MDKDTIWEKICQHQGELFETVGKKLPLIYEIHGDTLIHNRASVTISRKDFEKAVSMNPKNTADLHNAVPGPAYVFAIITDKRMR